MSSRTFARVVSGTVVELLVSTLDPTVLMPAAGWVDASAIAGVAAGWTYASGSWSAPVAAKSPAAKVSSLQFMALLTSAEQTAIATAAQSNAAVLVWLLKISGATFVDLGDAQTVAGVDTMVAAGLLTAARAAAILANQAPAS